MCVKTNSITCFILPIHVGQDYHPFSQGRHLSPLLAPPPLQPCPLVWLGWAWYAERVVEPGVCCLALPHRQSRSQSLFLIPLQIPQMNLNKKYQL